MIKINKNDTLADIMRKMQNSGEKDISLEFPFGHPILHNFISLKILKNKAGKKDLIIFTNDKTAKKIGKKIGIKYNLVTKPDIPESDYTFGEYFLYTIKNYFKEFKNFVTNKARENSFAKYQKIYTNGKIGFFVFFLLASIVLLIFIFYFAVNKTQIYITPEIENRPRGRNFIFQKMGNDDLTLESNIIKLKEIEKTVELETKIMTSGIDERDNKRATGEIKVFNFTEKSAKFRENSSIVTKEGILFTINGDFTIPPLVETEDGEKIPGEVIVKATASTYDINNKIIGKRGNIKSGETLTFAKLPKEQISDYYAISNSDFSGGTNPSTNIVSKTDLENAKSILKGKLEKFALDEIKKEINEENKINNTKYEILGVNNMIRYSNFKYSGIEDLKEGMKIKDFDISGSIKITVYTYNKEVLMNKLRNVIKEGLLENIESIFNIDENSLSIVNEIWREENPLRIKATAQVDVLYIQNFLSDTNNFVDKLKYQIAGQTKEDAEKILLNTGKISNVQIEIRPFFINKISNIIDNIKFEVK